MSFRYDSPTGGYYEDNVYTTPNHHSYAADFMSACLQSGMDEDEATDFYWEIMEQASSMLEAYDIEMNPDEDITGDGYLTATKAVSLDTDGLEPKLAQTFRTSGRDIRALAKTVVDWIRNNF